MSTSTQAYEQAYAHTNFLHMGDDAKPKLLLMCALSLPLALALRGDDRVSGCVVNEHYCGDSYRSFFAARAVVNTFARSRARLPVRHSQLCRIETTRTRALQSLCAS